MQVNRAESAGIRCSFVELRGLSVLPFLDISSSSSSSISTALSLQFLIFQTFAHFWCVVHSFAVVASLPLCTAQAILCLGSSW